MWYETLKALRRWLLAAALCFAYLVLLSECDRPAVAQPAAAVRTERSADTAAPPVPEAPVNEDCMSLGIEPPMPFEPTDEDLARMGILP